MQLLSHAANGDGVSCTMVSKVVLLGWAPKDGAYSVPYGHSTRYNREPQTEAYSDDDDDDDHDDDHDDVFIVGTS